ncbi:uncharacterized protein LOC122304723 [Carya illinoinensis]|uniref:uncharacterized protein LOC122304723 n=1 Tax=Carya illinoinensis TaxID=32201 RepID=UPI001C72363B|nr:uncharacterized protein LOC122304723 [Carya illinoinensis]
MNIQLAIQSRTWRRRARKPSSPIVPNKLTRENAEEQNKGESEPVAGRKGKRKAVNKTLTKKRVVDSMGSSGGLAMMWKNNLEVQLISFTRWHISVMIADKRHNTSWMLTGFYGHPVTSKRKLSWNLLRELKPSQGIPWLCIGDFNEILYQKEKLFSTSSPSEFTTCLQSMDKKVTNAMNNKLLLKFTEEEVHDAVSHMNALGSPSPDGFLAHFYQNHWESIGNETSNFVLKILNQGDSLKGVNDTFITLIPKVKDPKTVFEFRPISLYNVSYKIVAKVLANRLKLILPDIISLNQSAFVPGRLITDNVVAAYETFHTMNSKIKGKAGFMALKLDMSKAYDRVEWSFLWAVMEKMGFASQWISLIMNYGSLLLRKANSLEWCRVLHILETYEIASGQMLNKDKTSIFFSRNNPKDIQRNIIQILGIKSSGSFEKYLGLPTLLGRSKVAAFHSLLDRIWSRITNWKTKWLSAIGKEVLLKAVLQAIPTYTMGIFLLPMSISNKVNKLMKKFWCGFNEDHSKMQWLKWDKLNQGKTKGALGFRDFKSFNTAMLAKQGWQILKSPQSLPAQILKQKYFPDGNFLGAKLGL